MTRRRVLLGSSALIAYVIVYHLACMLLPEESLAALLVSDLAFCFLEVIAIVLCALAFWWTRESGGRWVWLFVELWLGFNLLGDGAWAYSQLVLGEEMPAAGLGDVAYLLSYPAAFLAVAVAVWKSSGRLRMLETTVDAAMFTIGVAAISWPLLLRPLLSVSDTGSEYWFSLAFPIGDLLVIFAFVSFFLGSVGPGPARRRPYHLILLVAFLCQVVSDAAYFMIVAVDADYVPGNWLDPVWLLAFALAGTAALSEIRASRQPTIADDSSATELPQHHRRVLAPGQWRIVIPYVALAVLAVMVALELREGWVWGRDTKVLVYLGLADVALLLLRQYLVLLQNRGLNIDLQLTSRELRERVKTLADLTQRLELLNQQSQRLNTLRNVKEVAEAGLELACTFGRCAGGWLTVRDGTGLERVMAVRGEVEGLRSDAPALNTVADADGVLRTMALEVRGDVLGAIWLARPAGSDQEVDLLPVIATHVATALDNAKRYEEALHLAERDALTGLFNHRGIHRRLAGEALRAQQNRHELSLVMMDLDHFKVLNDTYGHPTGDSVLKGVSNALRSVLRHADLAGRVGGDELLVVLPNTGTDGALQFCERLRNALHSKPYVTPDGESIPVRFSLGVATYPKDAQSLGQLIEAADTNLYSSKQSGGDTTTGSSETRRPTRVDAGILGVTGQLLSVVDARDNYTRRHSEHVALYALSLGQATGLPDDSLATLHVAALLHDVGKIGVPDGLLEKPGPLDAGEEDMVRRHAELSAVVITDLPRLARVAEAVRSHHERHDGGGYPEETSGDDIPVISRILAIADAYSAMTLDRPYRKCLTPKEARTELLRASGSQFDPVLVERFVRLLDEQEVDGEMAGSEAG